MQQPSNLLSGQELLHAYTTSYYDFLGNNQKYYVMTGFGPPLATEKKPTKKKKSWKLTDSGWPAQVYLNAFYAESKLEHPQLLEFILFWTHWLLMNNEEGKPVLYKNKHINIKPSRLGDDKSW